jgi:hypothetical protein
MLTHTAPLVRHGIANHTRVEVRRRHPGAQEQRHLRARGRSDNQRRLARVPSRTRVKRCDDARMKRMPDGTART